MDVFYFSGYITLLKVVLFFKTWVKIAKRGVDNNLKSHILAT